MTENEISLKITCTLISIFAIPKKAKSNYTRLLISLRNFSFISHRGLLMAN